MQNYSADIMSSSSHKQVEHKSENEYDSNQNFYAFVIFQFMGVAI